LISKLEIVEVIIDGTKKIGWKCNNITQILQYILQIESNETTKTPERLLIKISGDGRRHKGGQNIFTLNSLNLNQFDTQKRDSVFPIILWKGKESIIRDISKSTIRQIFRCHDHGFFFANEATSTFKHVPVDFIWSSDLCFLDSICDGTLYSKSTMFCPYCCASKEEANEFNTQHGQRKISIFRRVIQVPICNLHMKQVITRRLLHNMFLLYSHDSKSISEMEKTISSIPGLYGFKLKVLCTPLNPMDDFDDDDCGQCKVIDALYTGDTINKGVGAVYPKGTITT
jgi:hypothetical protein